ncbi:MAG: glycosyl transferase, partial [Acidobacteriota bacterium]
MADFIQNGSITTLHNLRGRSLEDFEAKLHEWGRERPIALVLPSLFSELEGPALDNIVTELSKATYIRQIIIGLDRADERQFEQAKKFFSRLPQEHHVLWNDGPRLRAIDEILDRHGLAPKEPGKGRNVWY